MTEPVREEAERLLQDITPGAWRTHQYDPDDDLFVVLDDNEPGVAEIARIEDQSEATANAHFIAAAPRLVRELLALLAILQSREQAPEPMFPIQSQRGAKPHPTRIPWSVADKAYSVYSARYGHDQSLERLAQRGGFGPDEMDEFLPNWREECSEIARLRTQRDDALTELSETRRYWQAAKAELESREQALKALIEKWDGLREHPEWSGWHPFFHVGVNHCANELAEFLKSESREQAQEPETDRP